MRIVKDKKCKWCGTVFRPYKTTDKFCSTYCFIDDHKEKEWKKEVKIRKEKLKTHKDYIKDFQVIINKLIRIIDFGHNCISCGRNGKPQSGHYHSTQANPSLRFNLFNIWLQDYYCNVQLSANIIGYNKGLINEFGIQLKEYIETGLVAEIREIKPSIPELKEAIEKTKQIIKQLPKEKIYSKSERIELRKKFNEEIGIYK